MRKIDEETVCVICHKPMGWNFGARHYFHNDDCPNHMWEMNDGIGFAGECSCDNPCHPDCCPVCNLEKER